jgi:Na+-driven multidrug efflux pump
MGLRPFKGDRRAYLTETPVPKLICTLAGPTILSMLVTGIYNSADTYFVGRISTQGTAAVGLVFSVMAIIQAMGFFCGQGSGNYLSRLLGAGERKKADEIAATGFVLALILGVLLALFGKLFVRPFADLLGAPFMMGQCVINNQLRFQGSAFYAMIGLMCGAVVNIGLDPLLMFGFGLGIPGAAIATISGQFIGFCTLLVGSRRGENIRLDLRNVRLSAHNLLQIVNGGLPSLVRQGMAAIAVVLLNRYANACGGDAAIAGMSIVNRVMMLLSSALIGFGQGYQPVCSFNYGAKLYGRVREGFFFCLKYGTILMSAASLLCLLFPTRIIAFFRNDPAVIAVGATALRWQASALPLMATSILTNMMLQASGQGLRSSITSSARNGVFFIPLILTLPRLFGLRGVEMTQAWADVLTFLLCLPFLRASLRRMKEAEAR